MTRREREAERVNREFWDDDADDYQEAHAEQLGDGVEAWGVWQIPESELRVLDPVEGRRVLELGCGGAQWSVQIAQRGAVAFGLDQSRAQLRHAQRNADDAGVRVRLLAASATAIPAGEASFDVVFCDHGAMSFCDPHATIPEVARVLRPGGQLAFSISSLLHAVCFPKGDPDAPITRTLHRPFFRRKRSFDWGDGTIDFQMPHGEWIRAFRRHGFEVEDLIELRPPEGARTTYGGFVDHGWARRWPAEEIWRVRRR